MDGYFDCYNEMDSVWMFIFHMEKDTIDHS